MEHVGWYSQSHCGPIDQMYSVIVRIVNTLEQNGADYMLHACVRLSESAGRRTLDAAEPAPASKSQTK